MTAQDRANERRAREDAAARSGPTATAPIPPASPPPREAVQAPGGPLAGVNPFLMRQGQGAVAGVLNAFSEAADGAGALVDAGADFARDMRTFGEVITGQDLGGPSLPEQLTASLRRHGVIDDDGEVAPNAPAWVATPRGAELTEGVSRFLTGFVTLGKVLGPAAAGREALAVGGRTIVAEGWGAQALRASASSTTRGAATDLTVWDGQEARLSNILRDHASFRDPVTAFLAADENDGEIEGRVKGVLEGAGLGVIADSFIAGLRSLRIARRVRAGLTTESEAADAARTAALAIETDAVRIRVNAQRASRQYRAQEINATAEARLRGLNERTFGEGAATHRRDIDTVTANTAEMRAINEGADPTSLSPRQQAVLAAHEKAAQQIEAERVSALRVEELEDTARAGDLPGVLRLVRDINAERSARSVPVTVGTEQVSRRAGPVDAPALPAQGPVRVFFANGGEEVARILREGVLDAEGNFYPNANFRPVVDGAGNVRLVPATGAAQAAASPRGIRAVSAELATQADAIATASGTSRFTASTHTVDIIPDHPVKTADMIRAARSQAERLALEAERGGSPVASAASRAEAERVSELADQLEAAVNAGESANSSAARLYDHLDDAAITALFRKRPPSDAEAVIGQTDAEAIERAFGRAGPQSPVIDAAFVRRIAENFSAAGDVASASVRQRARLWRDGDPIIHSKDIPLDRLDTSDQVRAFVSQYVDLAEGAIRHARGETAGNAAAGVRTDAQRHAVAQALAKDMGTDSASLIARVAEITGNAAHLDSKVEALRALHVTAADGAQRHMRNYLASHSEGDLSHALHALQAFATIHSALKGTTSEIGRALRSLRDTVSPDRSLVEQFGQIVDEGVLRALDPQGGATNALDALQRIGSAIKNTNRRGMGRIFDARASRAIEDFYTASILSAPSTHVLNSIGNAATTLVAPVERMLGGAVRGAFTGDLGGIREAVDHAHALLLTADDSFRMARRAFADNRTFLDSSFSSEFRSNFTAEAFGINPDQFFGRSLNAFGKVIGVVNRLMGAQDEFWKQINYRSMLYAQALRDGREARLAGSALADYVDEYVTRGFTKEGRSVRAGVRPEDMDIRNNAADRALRSARRNTFTEHPGAILGKLETGLRSIPFGRLVIPFYRTPISIVKYAARRSGLSGSLLADITGNSGKSAQEQAIGQVVLGMSLYGSATLMALNGLITGAGPADPNVRRALTEAGWQPYSVKIGGRYYAYNRADPFGLFFSTTADTVDVINEEYAERPDDPAELGGLIIVNLAQTLRDKSFFQGIDTIFSAIENADQDVEIEHVTKLLGNYTGALVPAAVSRLTDDGFMHRPRSIIDAVRARLPWRDGVEYRRNWLGERIGAAQPLLAHAFISPSGSTQAGGDAALDAIAQLAVESRGGLSSVERRLESVDLTEYRSPVTGRNAYDRVQELMSETQLNGRTFRQSVEELVTSDRYQDVLTSGAVEGALDVRGTRHTALAAIRRRYLNSAVRQVRDEIPELDARVAQAEALKRSARRPSSEQRGAELPRGLEWLNR